MLAVMLLAGCGAGIAPPGESRFPKGHDGPPTSWSGAVRAARRAHVDASETFWCSCPYRQALAGPAGRIVQSSCGYRPDGRFGNRIGRIEWDHVVTADQMVHHLACGSRDRCYRRSAPFRDAFLDIHNLVPAEGDLNGIRSNRPVGEVRGEGRRFGDCGAEVGRDRFEPPDDRRGDAARIVFLMRDRHGIPIEPRDMRVLTRWNRQDPVDQRERARDRMIQQVLAGSR